MTDPFIERLFTGIPEEIAKLRPYVAELEAFNARAAQSACGATAIFWPDVEACEAECFRPQGHGGTVHEDDILGEWDEDDVPTCHPTR